jgi:hypothetical protein
VQRLPTSPTYHSPCEHNTLSFIPIIPSLLHIHCHPSFNMLSSKTLATQTRGISNTLIASRLLTTSFGNRHLRPTVGAAVVASIDGLFPSCRRQNSTKSCTSTTRASSSTATNNVSNESDSLQPEFHPIYVHHVSRVALEHLQDSQSDWLVARASIATCKFVKMEPLFSSFPNMVAFGPATIPTNANTG